MFKINQHAYGFMKTAARSFKICCMSGFLTIRQKR